MACLLTMIEWWAKMLLHDRFNMEACPVQKIMDAQTSQQVIATCTSPYNYCSLLVTFPAISSQLVYLLLQHETHHWRALMKEKGLTCTEWEKERERGKEEEGNGKNVKREKVTHTPQKPFPILILDGNRFCCLQTVKCIYHTTSRARKK